MPTSSTMEAARSGRGATEDKEKTTFSTTIFPTPFIQDTTLLAAEVAEDTGGTGFLARLKYYVNEPVAVTGLAIVMNELVTMDDLNRIYSSSLRFYT